MERGLDIITELGRDINQKASLNLGLDLNHDFSSKGGYLLLLPMVSRRGFGLGMLSRTLLELRNDFLNVATSENHIRAELRKSIGGACEEEQSDQSENEERGFHFLCMIRLCGSECKCASLQGIDEGNDLKGGEKDCRDAREYGIQFRR